MRKSSIIIASSALLAVLIVTSYKQSFEVKSATSHVVISEVQMGGDNGADDEFIELYNPTENDVDLSSWSIQRETISGSFSKKNFVEPAIIYSHGFYLIAHNDYNNSSISPDMSHSSFTLSSTGTTVFLVNDQVVLVTGDESSIVDKVAIGESALDAETSSFSSIPDNDQSIERKPGESDALAGNGEDTDNNSIDFSIRTLSEPQNTTSLVEPALESPTETEEPTPTPTEETSPTPSEELSPTPTEEASPTPTEGTPTESPQATPTEEATPTQEPTSTPTPNQTPTPTPTQLQVIGFFPTLGGKTVCGLRYNLISFGFFRFYFPTMVCFTL